MAVRSRLLALPAVAFMPLAAAQMPNMEVAQKWSNAKVVHYEVVGEATLKGHQIPPVDADLYADVTDRVRLSFDWDVRKRAFVGNPTFVNEPGKATNVVGMDKGEKNRKRCPTGNINGTYEHFDVVEVRQLQPGSQSLELLGKRIHPETQVAEACGNKLRTYKGATKDVKEYTAVPDPKILAMGNMMSGPGPKVSPDGKSIVISAPNSPWVWTFTPTVK